MNGGPESVRVVREWVGKAEEDFRNAEYTLTMKEHCPFSTVLFHAQQTAEKYLKALLALHAIEFPKSHDLGELAALLAPEIRLPLTPREEETLTQYATSSRYPGFPGTPTRGEAEEAVACAGKLRAAARALLPAESLLD
jgi:HEPN domain-containing protein